MFDYGERKYIRSIIYSKISIFILVIFVVLIIKNVWIAYQDEKITRINNEVARQELNELNGGEKNILFEIEKLETRLGREEEIRNKFRVAKEGEEMVMIINEKNDIGTEYEALKESLWGNFLIFFKDIDI